MIPIKIGIIREGKIPTDARAPLSPEQCKVLAEKYPKIEVKVQSSEIRCFADNEYLEQGVEVAEDISDCNILLGVKEVPIDRLVQDKTYLFFSHTMKKQPYNRGLLEELIRQNIRMIDYECLTDDRGMRVIAFGKWAGVVGAHNGLLAWGKKTGKIDLKRVFEYKDYAELKEDYDKINVPPLRIIITGDGRVAKGSVEVMEHLNIRSVIPEKFLSQSFNEPIFTQLSPKDIYEHKEGRPFDLQEFFKMPQDYKCDFHKWYSHTDLMVNAIYWDPNAPVYFTLEEMRSPDFNIQVIADISCDINGSVPATLRTTTIVDPVFGYDPVTQKETLPYQPHTIDIMAIDNLPNELPRDASESFGQILLDEVIPELLNDHSDMIKRATIVENGNLTPKFEYLSDYLEGK